MKRVLLVAGCLLLGGIAIAQQSLPVDEVVGRAWFDVQKSANGHAWMLPKTQVVFGVQRISVYGADMPNGLAQCQLIKRTVEHSEKLNAAITVTVLKCGEYEYGISEVMFDDGKK